MFDDLTMHGGEATLIWGWRTAAVCRAWSVRRTKDGAWSLDATITRHDAFILKQRPLLFTAPRKGGRFCWPVRVVDVVSPTQVRASLGPPEY